MCKVILMLDKYFLKYERGVKLITPPPPQKKLPSKRPALLGLRGYFDVDLLTKRFQQNSCIWSKLCIQEWLLIKTLKIKIKMLLYSSWHEVWNAPIFETNLWQFMRTWHLTTWLLPSFKPFETSSVWFVVTENQTKFRLHF